MLRCGVFGTRSRVPADAKQKPRLPPWRGLRRRGRAELRREHGGAGAAPPRAAGVADRRNDPRRLRPAPAARPISQPPPAAARRRNSTCCSAVAGSPAGAAPGPPRRAVPSGRVALQVPVELRLPDHRGEKATSAAGAVNHSSPKAVRPRPGEARPAPGPRPAAGCRPTVISPQQAAVKALVGLPCGHHIALAAGGRTPSTSALRKRWPSEASSSEAAHGEGAAASAPAAAARVVEVTARALQHLAGENLLQALLAARSLPGSRAASSLETGARRSSAVPTGSLTAAFAAISLRAARPAPRGRLRQPESL